MPYISLTVSGGGIAQEHWKRGRRFPHIYSYNIGNCLLFMHDINYIPRFTVLLLFALLPISLMLSSFLSEVSESHVCM